MDFVGHISVGIFICIYVTSTDLEKRDGKKALYIINKYREESQIKINQKKKKIAVFEEESKSWPLDLYG